MNRVLSSAMGPPTRIFVIFLSSFVIVTPAISRVVDTSVLPLNGWPIEDFNLPQNDNSESLEDELESLHPPTPNPSAAVPFSSDEDENSVESFDDEIDDVGQQRERPLEGLEEAEKNAKEITVTTLVPSVLTEENTRVDEPTERGPAEPTKENGATATSVMSEVQTYSSSPSSSVNAKRLSQKEKIPDWKQQSEEEQLLEMKELRRDEDGENDGDDSEDEDRDDDEDDNDDDDFFSEEMEGDELVITDSDFDKMTKGSSDDVTNDSQTKMQLREALQENGLFSRSTRHTKGLVNPGYEEEMLEFLVRLSKNPRGWARVSEILGKMDYDTSSRLKTALQMKALQDNRKSYQTNLKEQQRKIMNAHSFSNKMPNSENDVVKLHLTEEHNKSKSNKNLQIKSHKNRNNKLEKDLYPTKNPVHIDVDMQWHKGNPKLFHKAHSKVNPYDKDLPFRRQMDDFYDSQLQESELQRLSETHGGPLNAIAIDIPDRNMFANRFPDDDNKHAYVAVSVYKPTKENYHRIDIDPKANSYPARYPTPKPISKVNRKFAVEKPVTIVDPPMTKGSEGSRHNDFSQRLPNATKTRKGKNKFPKQVKNEESLQHHKPKSSQRLGKHKSKLATDEIEAQLIALTKMEQKLRQHLLEKEKLRQRLRTGHRLPRSSYM